MDVNQLIQNKEAEIKRMVELELSLFKFELADTSLDKKERERSIKAVEKFRKQEWKKALKQAKGDIKKAMSIYASS